MKLRTFVTMKRTAKNKVKNKVIPIESHSNMFEQLALLMQHHEINLKGVFEYPIGLYPWILCASMGELRKICKSTLLQILEKGFDPEKQIDDETTTVLDGIALVGKIKTSGKTFGEMSDILLQTVLNRGRNSRRIDWVFDVYRDHSIKNAERTRRRSETLLFQNLHSTQLIKQWNQFLSSSHDKKELVKFVVNHWKQKTLFIGNKHLYIGYEDNCICFSPDGTVDVPELASNHEDADTRILLHMNPNIDQSDIRKKNCYSYTRHRCVCFMFRLSP